MLVLSIDHRLVDSATIADLGSRAVVLQSRLQSEPSVRGVVVLATCARVEAYVDGSSFHGPQRAFVEALDVDASLVRNRRGIDGLEHLFRVATGLESAVVGEAQVAGQVRDALLTARSRGNSTRTLDLAFENAIRVSRQARGVLSGQPSIVGAALDLVGAQLLLGTALVVGTGAFARACIGELRERGAHTVWAFSPSGRDVTPGGADHLVSEDELVSALALSDVTVTASGRGTASISSSIARAAVGLRSTPLVLVDLAAASDVAADLDDDADILVLRLADVTQSSNGAGAASKLVRAEARQLYPRIEGGELDELIVRLRTHVHEVALAELGATPEPSAVEAVRRMTQALLHHPTARAREAAANGELDRYRAALEQVFDLDSAAAHSAPAREEGSAA